MFYSFLPISILALGAIIGVVLIITLMTNKEGKMTAKDFFLHIAILATLYVSIISVITLLVQTIHVAFPDALDGYYYYGYTDGLRFAVASLIIVFPVFLILSWWNHKEIAKDGSLKDLTIKRWFGFLTLFASGATIIVNLIVFLNAFLGGEITTRFILKVLAVFLVSALVFVYHLFEIRKVVVSRATYRTFSALAIILVITSIVWSFFVMGSPMKQRSLRLDRERINHLSSIQWQVLDYWQRTEKLPQTLEETRNDFSGQQVFVDPETKEPYEYRPTSDLTFELCATFKLSSKELNYNQNGYPMDVAVTRPMGGQDNSFDVWEHQPGRACFTRTIDPEIYAPYPTERL